MHSLYGVVSDVSIESYGFIGIKIRFEEKVNQLAGVEVFLSLAVQFAVRMKRFYLHIPAPKKISGASNWHNNQFANERSEFSAWLIRSTERIFCGFPGMGKAVHLVRHQHGIRRFDWPACFQAFSNRPDKSPHQNRTYTAAHPTDA
jgi:hypothetical protein